MAATGGSSASATQYDVFLSFRGSDTRNTFTDCLYRTMVDRGIVAYRDSEELHAGDRIDDLLRAVGNCKICIPVLSRGYASSSWCLRELACAMGLNESDRKPEILPIFFDVTPLEVKLRTDLYLKDLENHEQRHGAEIRQRWGAALGKVAEIKGWEVQGKPHGEIIDFVVKEVLYKLEVKQRPLEGNLVWVDEQVEAIMKLLDVDSGTGVVFVGIHGMGGIGKTTLAKIVYNKLCSHFDGQCSFIGDIRESSKKNGLVNLQKQLATNIFGSRFVETYGESMGRSARSKKVLIVLDDLDNKEQLKKLVGGPDTFNYGSKIIITTRDKQILDEEAILPYEVKQMDFNKALELFSLHAFDNVSPPNAHKSLSQEVVSTTGGLPLALEVIGAALRGKEIKIWEEWLQKLKRAPHKEVRNKLKISYDALEYEEKEIFLDIACFFINEKKSMPVYFWGACNLSPHITLEKLTNLCLTKIVNGDVIWMHDQLRDFGRDIVHQECTRNLTRRSRLWNYEEALEVLTSNERKDNVQALNLNKYGWSPINIRDEHLERMPNLKFLRQHVVTFDGDINNYLQKLRWLSWDSPPLDYKMVNMHLKNLVVFKLSNNDNTDNWGGWNILKMANKLKVLYLYSCGGLERTPDFSGCTSLEMLSLDDCFNLREVDSSIGKLKDLTHLQISFSRLLRNLPEEIGGLVKLEHFRINGSKIKKLPNIEKLTSLSKLDISYTNITSLPDSIGNAKNLSSLDLSGTSIAKLPKSIGNLTTLQNLNLSYTIKNVKLPNSIKNLKQLKVTRMESLLDFSFGTLESLENLNVRYWRQPQGLPKLPLSLNHLHVLSASLRLVPDLSYLRNLVNLELSNNFGQALAQASTLQLQWVGKLSKLEQLELCLSDLPVSSTELGCLPRLKKLILSRMDSFDLVVVGPQFSHLKNLSTLHLCHCSLREIQFDELELLGDLTVTYCKFLKRLSVISSSLRKLSGMEVRNCPKLLHIQFLSTMESLERLEVGYCKSLRGLYGLSNSKKLKTLRFVTCPVLRVIEGLEELELLQRLYFTTCPSVKVLTNLSNSKISNECWIYVYDCEKLPGYDSKISNECWIYVYDCEKLPGYDYSRYGDYGEEILDWMRRGLNQEDVAQFLKSGRPLILQEDARETDAEESVMETNNYYSQNLPLTIGFLWSPEPDTELDSTSLNNSQVPPRTTSSDVSRSSCSIL